MDNLSALLFGDGEPEAVGAGTMEASAQGLLEGIGLDGDTLAPMETDEPSSSDPKGKSKITPAMAARIKQIKPLLSGEKKSVGIGSEKRGELLNGMQYL